MANETKLTIILFTLIFSASSCNPRSIKGVYTGKRSELVRHKVVFSDSTFVLTEVGSMINDTIRGHYYLDKSTITFINDKTTTNLLRFQDTLKGKTIGKSKLRIRGIEYKKTNPPATARVLSREQPKETHPR